MCHLKQTMSAKRLHFVSEPPTTGASQQHQHEPRAPITIFTPKTFTLFKYKLHIMKSSSYQNLKSSTKLGVIKNVFNYIEKDNIAFLTNFKFYSFRFISLAFNPFYTSYLFPNTNFFVLFSHEWVNSGTTLENEQ